MTACKEFVTRTEFNQLKRIVEQKLDKSDEPRIIQSSVSIAVPLAIAQAFSMLYPDIQKALTLGQAAKNTALANVKKIATNAGNIIGNASAILTNVANIAGLLISVAALGIAFKHEFVDLPEVRRNIINNQIKIQENAREIRRNKVIVAENKKEIFRLNFAIERNNIAIDKNKRGIDENRRILNSNKAIVLANEQNIKTNRNRIEAVNAAYKKDIIDSERKVKIETFAAIGTAEKRLNARVDAVNNRLNKKIDEVNQKLAIEKALTNANLSVQSSLLKELTNSIAEIQTNVSNLDRKKAEKQELIVVRRQVGDLGNVVNQELPKVLEQGKELAINIANQNTVGGTVDAQQLQNLRRDINKDFEASLGSLGLVAVPGLLNAFRNESLNVGQVTNAVQQGICNSSNGSGCLNTKIRNPLEGKLNDILSGIGATSSSVNVALNNNILNRVTDIQSQVNNASHGLQATKTFLSNAWNSTAVDKTLNAVNTVLLIHNASMLSSNLAVSIGEAVSLGLNAIGITDAEGNALDVNAFISSRITSTIQSVVGAENYNQLTVAWATANRIYQTGINVLDATRNLIESGRALNELTLSYTGKIGNALREAGTVYEDAYSEMEERVTAFTPQQRKFERFREGLETIEEGANSVSEIAGTIVETKDSFTELKSTWEEWETEMEAIRLEKKELIETNKIDSTSSATPTDTDFIRNEGEETP